MMPNNKKKIIGFLAVLALPLIFDSCKKEDTSFVPVKVESAEDKLVGTWNVISTKAVGTVKILGKKVPATGENKDTPEGFYELKKDPNDYSYNLKTTLEMKAAGLKQDYDYNDKDAGTWEVSEDEKSVVFIGNQGITQTLFFTQYDSNETQYMDLAIPVDTTLKGLDYEGTIFLKMFKSN